jgi:hypothetical protein
MLAELVVMASLLALVQAVAVAVAGLLMVISL